MQQRSPAGPDAARTNPTTAVRDLMPRDAGEAADTAPTA
jgi:hypothetical protein